MAREPKHNSRLLLRPRGSIPAQDLPDEDQLVSCGARLEARWGLSGTDAEHWWPATLLAVYETASEASNLPIPDDEFVPLPEKEAVFCLIQYEARYGYQADSHLVKFTADVIPMMLHLTPGRDCGRLVQFRILSTGAQLSPPPIRKCKSVAIRRAPKMIWEKRPSKSSRLYGEYTILNPVDPRKKRKRAKWPAKVVGEVCFSIGGARAILSLVEFEPNSAAGHAEASVLYLGFVNPNQNFCELHAGGELVDYRTIKSD